MSRDWSSLSDRALHNAEAIKSSSILSIDRDDESASFMGSSGDLYHVTLESCTCIAFSRCSNDPCKHMIRLAQELGCFSEMCCQTPPAKKTRPGKKAHAPLVLSDYVVVDLETTDKYINTAGILDFGAARISNGRVVDTFSMLANPGIPNKAEHINHISADMISAAPPVIDVLQLFLDFIGDSPVVGYNINSFDSCLIYDQSVLCFDRPFTNDIVDVYLLSHRTNNAHYKLSELCSLYNIENEQAHRALSDALCTHKLYEILKHYIYLGEPHPASFALGGYSDSIIYDNILRITADSAQNVVLKSNKTGSSIFMFGSLAFTIKMNSRSQYIETPAADAGEFVSLISGASSAKSGYRFPIACDKETAPVYEEMILAVYEQRKSSAAVEHFGCCNDFVRCSDARECLHKDNTEYLGCYYRQNLEAGRIFYGKNRNVESFKSSSPDQKKA